ncbi:hypothetical protein [Mangrovivirga cuniculi]|uniref:hypothetical protein n=1 Tax=Mangrovivirga cuniculi TaxID=2715131 RepID=UPI0010BF0E6A|nr:hypothetical protein [Mangrovivirga cuniculi]
MLVTGFAMIPRTGQVVLTYPPRQASVCRFPMNAGQALFVSTGFCSLASFTAYLTVNQPRRIGTGFATY